MKIYAETERLILREIVPTDDVGMFELDSSAEVHRYLGNAPISRIDQSREIITFVRQQYIEFGIARWAVEEKSTGEFIGWCGLKYVTEPTNDHVNYYDIGYRFIKRHWGKGYAIESAMAALKYGFDLLKLPVVYGMAHAENDGSNHVLQKLGLQFVEMFDHKGSAHNWYVLSNQHV